MTKKNEIEQLSEKHEAFIRAYLIENNATRAYMQVYGSEYDSASTSASRLLKNDKIQARIQELNKDLEKQLGISKGKVVDEFMKIAFGSFADLLDGDWLTQKQFDELTDRQKACIAEVKSETIMIDKNVTKEVLKIKLHDKQKALENIAKLLGYNEQTEGSANLNIQINIVNPNKK